MDLAIALLTTLGGLLGGHTREIIREVDNPRLLQQLEEYRQQNAQLQAKFDEIAKTIRDSKIDSFEDLQRFDEKSAAALISLARQVTAIKLDGRNFGFFGITSTGKSTIINKLIGKNVAEVGVGETTTKVQAYEGSGYTLFDIPGRNDELSYFSMEYISFWKGLTDRFVVITTTVKEMTKVTSLLDSIDLPYDIIVNKLDIVAGEESDNFKEQIRKEVVQLGLKGCKRIWFVSAKNPDQFPDWLGMANYLTTTH